MELDDKFDMEKDFAIIKTKEMIKTISEGSRRGTVKFLDEIGVGLNHRKWYSFFHMVMSYIMQTFGFEGKIIIVTVPYEDLVDKDILKFFNMKIKMVGKDENRKFATAKIWTLEYDEQTKIIYRKYPRGKYPDGSIKTLPFFRIRFPPDDVLDHYFSISNPEKKNLQYDLMAQSNQMEAEKVRQNFNPEYYLGEILKDPSKFVKEYNQRKYIPTEKIMNSFPGIGTKRANQIKIMAEEKILGGRTGERSGTVGNKEAS